MLPSCFYPTIHSSITPPREFDLILPKLSAAILAMAMLGSAYAASSLERDISLDQWVMMSGATNGAADAVGASPDDRHAHRQTARTPLMRYALEQGLSLDEFRSEERRDGKGGVSTSRYRWSPEH